MSATKYTYSISTDFPNAKVESTRLTQEIQASAIVTALDRIDTAGDVCDIWFKDALSGGDQTILNGLVAAHSGAAIDPGTQHVELYTASGLPVPAAPDGRQIFMPLSFEDNVFLYIAGAGDHATNGRGEGNRFNLSRSTAGSSNVEWSFNDPVKIVGGHGNYTGGAAGDEISMEVYAPATPVTSTPGTGNCILVDTGFTVEGSTLYVIVPYPNGTHTVDLSAAVPVPASVGEGSFYLWTSDALGVGKGTVTAQASGGFNLYTINVPLSRQVANLQLLGSGDLNVEVSNVKPLIMLPHWKFKATLTTAGARDVSAVWELKVTRTRTTKIW